MLCDDLGEMRGVEGGSRGRDTYIYNFDCFALYSRNQHCKANFLQLKNKLKKNVSRHCHKSPEA